MTGAVADAAENLSRYLGRAEGLLAVPGTVSAAVIAGSTTASGSSPPWNSEAANAYFTAAEGVRRLDKSLRAAHGFGDSTRVAADYDGQLRNMLGEIVAHSFSFDRDETKRVARLLGGWSAGIAGIRDIDELVSWARIRLSDDPGALPPVCPQCETYSLMVADHGLQVACFNDDCAAAEGKQVTGILCVSRETGWAPGIIWADGTVTVAPKTDAA